MPVTAAEDRQQPGQMNDDVTAFDVAEGSTGMPSVELSDKAPVADRWRTDRVDATRRGQAVH
jgi:hypothetical protein